MKKISLYLLIFTMLYCLCACGKNSDAKSNSREDDGRKEQKDNHIINSGCFKYEGYACKGVPSERKIFGRNKLLVRWVRYYQ